MSRLLALSMLLSVSLSAAAHDSRPLYIELTETTLGHYLLRWKSPPSLPLFNLPSVTLSDGCREAEMPGEAKVGAQLLQYATYHCPQGVGGERLSIAYPGPNPSLSSLVRYRTVSGERHLAVLGPEASTWPVPRGETASSVASEYTVLGIEHIWAGVDHLLFLVCLLWIAGSWRRIVITITGFTLAHSATLILSALELVRLPIPPVEATIALSIVFLATEISKGRRRSLTWRYPLAVSSSFGLLHGFGFAAALGEIGLPQTELVTGLLFFNLGVEIGQVLFAAGVIGLIRTLQRLTGDWLQQTGRVAAVRTSAGYLVGVVATYWLVERCASFLPGAV